MLFRGRGMKRCRAKGRERFEMLVGAAVLANNLMRIAQLIEDKKPNRRISLRGSLPSPAALWMKCIPIPAANAELRLFRPFFGAITLAGR